jgi:glutathione S-transferase
VFPAAGLAPPVDHRGLYYRWLFFAAGPLEAAVTNRSLGLELPADKQGMVGYGSFESVMNTLEKAIPPDGYVAGDSFSAADVYVGSHIGWGMQFGSIEKRTGFAEYWARVSDRDAYRRANELDDALMPAESK